MKKILAISGSGRKNGDGIKALKLFEEKFDSKEYSFEVLHLVDYSIKTCIGCTVCFKKDKCFIKDDTDIIIDKMKLADGLIFITPIYNMNVSGILGTFLDRTTYLLHKPVFYDKHSYIISSTDVGGTKHVNLYLKYMMNAFCINNTGATGVFSHRIKHDEKYICDLSKSFEKEANKFKSALLKGKEYKPKFTQLIRFNLWRLKAFKSKEKYPGDYEYWSRSDLVDADYFYTVKISLVKKMILKLIKKRINVLLRKSM